MRFYKLAFSMLEVLISLALFSLLLLVLAKKSLLMRQFSQTLLLELQANLILDSWLECQVVKLPCQLPGKTFTLTSFADNAVALQWEYLGAKHVLRRSV
jgi:prepilin-type N-terminal cleavage/methylation domain-containing protein